MTARKVAIGLSLLCALLFSVFAAPSAMAVGTTIHTCTETGEATPESKKWSDAHCTKESELGKFSHVEIKPGVSTEVTGTNTENGPETKEATVATLILRFSGFNVFLSATGVHSEGTLINETTKEVMKAKGTSTTRYTGVKVTNFPKCTIKNEEFVTEANVRTKVNATGMWVEFEGKGAEEVLTEFTIEGGPECMFNLKKIRLRGIIVGTPTGATLEFKDHEPESTLRVGNELLGSTFYIGVETLRMKKGDPISFTTT